MALRPIDRQEAWQHILVMVICAILIVLPLFWVSLWKLQVSLIGLGIFFAVIDLLIFASLRRPRP
jgi:hypothetical protein